MADPRFFKKAGPFTLAELAEVSGAKIHHARYSAVLLHDVAPLDSAGPADISFLDNPKYAGQFSATSAGACVVKAKFADAAPEGIALLITEHPYHAYARIAAKFYPVLASSYPSTEHNIAASAIIDKTALIGENCTIEPNAVIGPGAEIGGNCRIRAGAIIAEGVKIGKECVINQLACIKNSIIGDRVIIHSGACIGQDGFGYASYEGKHVKIPQLGRVIIGDDVEIGANSCIDRGAGPDTVIGAGTKIDNLVQIGHNVRLGKGCMVAAGSGIAGSTTVGDYVLFGGQSGVAGHLAIGSRARIAAQAGVMRDVPEGAEVIGMPAIPPLQFHRQNVILSRLANKRKKDGA